MVWFSRNTPANNKSKTVYRRNDGVRGRILNTLRPLKHEPDRKARLVHAIMKKDIEESIHLIRNTGMTAKDINMSYGGFLILAIKNNQPAVVQALIAAGADVNARLLIKL